MKSVVMVSSMGDMWLEDKTARQLAAAMKSDTKFVTLNGNMIAVNSIRGLLTPEAYKVMVTTRRQHWVCRWGNLHAPTDRCDCQPSLPNLGRKELTEHEPTEEEKLRGKAMLEWMRKHKRDFKTMKDEVKREKFIKEWLKNNRKTLDKQ